MTKKRKSGGRSKGGQGRSGTVQCSYCGAQVPETRRRRSPGIPASSSPASSRSSRTPAPRSPATRPQSTSASAAQSTEES